MAETLVVYAILVAVSGLAVGRVIGSILNRKLQERKNRKLGIEDYEEVI